MIFISDYGENNSLVMNYTSKTDAVNWKDPEVMGQPVNTRLNYLPGFALNHDGKVLYLTNQKGGGLGGYDIYTSDLSGSRWSELKNLGLPVNTSQHEGCPSVSPDGLTLFFMRCAQMNPSGASECKLMMATRTSLSSRWGDPAELPDFINTGNSQTPRMMGDSETLIFSSDKLSPNKGGMDLYLTRWDGGQWSRPMPLEFANTEGDDQFVSATSQGRYLLKEVPGRLTTELAEVLFLTEPKPKATMKVEGKIISDSPSEAYITVYNKTNQIRVFNGRPNTDGTFTLYLKEGVTYTLDVDPEKDNYTYYSKSFDLTNTIPILTREEVSLSPVSRGSEIALDQVDFRPYGAQLTNESEQEIRRLTRMIKGNPGLKFNVDVSLIGLIKDSIPSSPDLTELETDTLHYTVTYQVADTSQYVSTPDSLSASPPSAIDSLSRNSPNSIAMDSTVAISYITLTRDSVVVNNTYHNDRTANQGLEILNTLVGLGVPGNSLSMTHSAVGEAIPENRKIRVKITAR